MCQHFVGIVTDEPVCFRLYARQEGLRGPQQLNDS